MKKIIIAIVMAASATFTFAQPKPSDWVENSPTRDVHNFECTETSVFSQITAEYNVGFFCDAGYLFSRVSDDFTASAPFTGMRFWGVYDVKPTETFTIGIYDGPPYDPVSNLVHTFNVSTSPIPTPYLRNGSVIHQFDADFGTTVTQLNGWVSVSRTTLPYNESFAWIGNNTEGNCLTFYSVDQAWYSLYGTVFFCLDTNIEPVPIPDWALFIGIGLIMIATVIHFRRLI